MSNDISSNQNSSKLGRILSYCIIGVVGFIFLSTLNLKRKPNG